jgi:2-dehydropantoate 2-reductase
MHQDMAETETVHVLGTGAVGLPLAAYLASAGRTVIAVRTGNVSAPVERTTVVIRGDALATDTISLDLVRLDELPKLDGIVVITAKAFANPAIAATLRARAFGGPVVILQNGLNVEAPFLANLGGEIYRGVLYVTSQTEAKRAAMFRQIASCPVGIVRGTEAGLRDCVAAITTPRFRFHAESDIRREVWKKTIINAVFNSICPLLDTDNGVFARDEVAADLSRQIVRECLVLARSQGIDLDEAGVIEQAMRISRGSDGVLISTLQDIRAGRSTEIESLNLAIARLAAESAPPIELPCTEFLGRMIQAKSRLQSGASALLPDLQ